MNEFAFIYIFMMAFFLCAALLIIFKIREKKSVLVTEEPDFYEVWYTRKRRELEISFPKITMSMYISMLAATPLFTICLFWILMPNKIFAVFMGASTVFLPNFIMRMVKEQRQGRFDERFVRALKTLSAALRSDYSIQQAVQEVAANIFIDEDIRAGFRQIDADIRVGISIEKAFRNYANKTGSNDVADVAAGIALQAEVGGSEASVIESITTNIEDRMLNRKKISALFSGTSFMVLAMDIIPFIAVLIMYFAMPGFIAPFFNSPGMMALFLGLIVFTMIGSVIIRRIIARAKGEI